MSDLFLKFLVRSGCHLCDDARPHVMRASQRLGVRVIEVDIDDDDRLLALYDMRIPVLMTADEVVAAEGVIEGGRPLRRAIKTALSS